MRGSPTLVEIGWFPKVASYDMLGEQPYYSIPAEARKALLKHFSNFIFVSKLFTFIFRCFSRLFSTNDSANTCHYGYQLLNDTAGIPGVSMIKLFNSKMMNILINLRFRLRITPFSIHLKKCLVVRGIYVM